MFKSKYTIYCFWTEQNPMSQQRQQCLQQLRDVSRCNVTLVTRESLSSYIRPEHPLHEGYRYLSAVHKSDYLRCYFMHFYGGGYADIKLTMGSWVKAFRDMEINPTALINGYQAGGPDNVSNTELKPYWQELIGVCQFIVRPRTEFTYEWYSEIHRMLDLNLEQLKQYPAKHPYDNSESGSGYPIGYTDLLGIPFNRIQYKYRNKTIFTVPKHYFSHYR
jgi:hypothetical protein